MFVRNEPIFHIKSSGVKLIYNILHNIEKTMKTVSSIPVLRYFILFIHRISAAFINNHYNGTILVIGKDKEWNVLTKSHQTAHE